MIKDMFFIHNYVVYQISSEPMMHPEGEIQIVALDTNSISPSVFGIESVGKLYDDHNIAFDKTQSKEPTK